MVARALTLILCGTVLSACASANIRDLSNRPPFNRYVGRTVPLLRPAYLIEEDFWTGPQYGIMDRWMRGALNNPLPVGHPIHLDGVKVNPSFSPCALAVGRTFVPSLGKEVPIHLYWAGPSRIQAGEYAMFRAPWEPKSVPEIRTTNDPAFLR
jgi:hypothetical protein